MKDDKLTPVGTRLDSETVEWLDKKCQEDGGRSRSKWIENLLKARKEEEEKHPHGKATNG